jgi:bifunctional non-homologous end joining protein LigD
MEIYDRGTYTTEKWQDDKVIVVLDGSRVRGKYALYRTDGKDWMIHRMDPRDPSWEPRPRHVRPMLPVTRRTLPSAEEWAYELKWTGERVLASVYGGRLLLVSASDEDVTARYREVRPLAEELAPTECLLDGVMVSIDGTPQLFVFDVLWLDGVSTLDLLPYAERRELLEALGIAGSHWQTPPYFPGGGAGARFARDASRAHGAAGVIAKRLDSPYRPGEVGDDWVAVGR